MIDEGMGKATLDAKKLAIQTIHVTVARDDTHQIAAARSQRHLAAVRTIRAGGNSLAQFPRPGLMPVGRVKQRPGGADFDAVAALRTVQPAAVRADHSVCAPATGFDGILAHPFVADARASFAED